MVSLIVSFDVAYQASVIDQRPNELQERLVFWTVGSTPQEFTYRRVGRLSTGAYVRLMLHDGHIGSPVADQRPRIPVGAFV